MIRWALYWFPLVPLMIANGIARESLYGPWMAPLAAHQLSTVIGAGLFTAYLLLVFPRLEMSGMSAAVRLGGFWLVLTVAFEFLFGHFVAGHPWSRLLRDYNLLHGRVWGLFLAWIALAPAVIQRLKGPGA